MRVGKKKKAWVTKGEAEDGSSRTKCPKRESSMQTRSNTRPRELGLEWER